MTCPRTHAKIAITMICVDPWPEARPERTVWLQYVNGVETEAELTALRQSVLRGAPYGQESWVERTAKRLGLEPTLRPRGRPRQDKARMRE